MKTTTTTAQNNYIRLKKDVVALMKETQGVLDAVRKKCGLDVDRYQLPIGEVEGDRMTLTLIGDFQSGKSTMFNYLCGGKELSPCGRIMGIPTSACQVVASALPEGRKDDYAEVTWYNREDIKKILSDYGLIDKDAKFDIDSKECRTKLEDDLRRRLAIQSSGGVELQASDREPYRHAVILMHYYEAFEDRIKSETPKQIGNLGAARRCASYPYRYVTRCVKVEDGSKNMDEVFTKEEVAFAFCKKLHYFVDSDVLKELKCDVEDCPGFFANACDTKVADRCVDQTDAILFNLKGETSLTLECLGKLKEQDKDVKDKLFFGANVLNGIKLWVWQGDLKSQCLSQLKPVMSKNVEIYDYHSALALRSLELYLLQQDECAKRRGKFPEYTREAIGQSIESEYKNSPEPKPGVKHYLEEKIDEFLRNFLGERIDKYKNKEGVDCLKILEKSQLPSFVGKVYEKISANKANAVLLKGTRRIGKLLNRAKDKANKKLERLAGDAEENEKSLKVKEKNLKDFRAVVLECTNDIQSSMGKFDKEVESWVKEQITDKYQRVEEEWVEELAVNLHDLTHRYDADNKVDRGRIVKLINCRIKELMGGLLANLRDEKLVSGFSKLASFCEVSKKLKYWGEEYQKHGSDLPGYESFADEKETWDKQDFDEQLKKLPIVLDDISGVEEINIWLLRNFLDPSEWGRTDKDRALEKANILLKEKGSTFTQIAHEHLIHILGSANGPWKKLNDYVHVLENAADDVEKALDKEKKDVEEENKMKTIDRQRVKKVLEPMIEKTIPDLLERCQDLDDEISEKFGKK